MTRKKRSLKAVIGMHRKYRDRLASFMLNELGINEAVHKDAWALLATEFAERLGILRFEWSEEKQEWLDSAKLKAGKGGRPASWTVAQKKELMQAVRAVMAEKRCTSNKAISLIKKRDKSGRWAAWANNTLVTRYGEFEKETSAERDRRQKEVGGRKARHLAKVIALELQREAEAKTLRKRRLP
ncbi:MAG: hypothetical protein QHD01_26230 [Bradyrhizobium sp.]|uniref:hypothetical protein n=1 Tax=Bradyrhizobium sp. TaxID=376 RepID=UPI0029B26015|nr:hypothetical protein [Bradyrhizobium sp.]MDX3970077.1 hypothetical protein [Bradyrhizobium sp.]